MEEDAAPVPAGAAGAPPENDASTGDVSGSKRARLTGLALLSSEFGAAVGQGPKYEALFATKEEAHCTVCDADINAANISNSRKHFTTKKHVDKEAARARVEKEGLVTAFAKAVTAKEARALDR